MSPLPDAPAPAPAPLPPSAPRESSHRGLSTQADIDALEGCVVILGDLVVSLMSADLKPLHALKRITGSMRLSSPQPEPASYTLERLEQLESIGGRATLERLALPSLAPLRNLAQRERAVPQPAPQSG